MERIQLLSENIKNKISAGEVVEGPFSVVKELMENAIDAGATAIQVQVLEAGLKKIAVTDNGHGIFSEDIELALCDHATSKIRDVHDIEHIGSYGFRGEALSSIASISVMTILSRSLSESSGTRITNEGGTHTVSPYAGPAGTTVIVENLFYNVPARKKFLRARPAEMKLLREAFLRLALPNHGVEFSLDVDGRRNITLRAAGTIDERVRQIYGDEVFGRLYYETLRDLKVSLGGFFSKPDFLRSSRSMQLYYINGRPVENRYLGFLLSRAYEAVAVKGKYPAAIIFTEIDPQLVDVNIHPAKREVKLFDQRYIDSLVLHLAEKALNRSHAMDASLFRETARGPDTVEEEEEGGRSGEDMTVSPVRRRDEEPPYRQFSVDASAETEPLPLRELPGLYTALKGQENYRILGTVFDTYIMVEKDNSLSFIDFHAAHERFIFDALMKPDRPVEIQELMFPVMMELPLDDFNVVMDSIERFSEIGFDIGEFSDKTITVRSFPAVAGKVDVEAFIHECIDEIRDERGKRDVRKSIAASAACHAAKRSGDLLSRSEMTVMINRIFSGEHELRCPHGRPFVHALRKEDLERIFKR